MKRRLTFILGIGLMATLGIWIGINPLFHKGSESNPTVPVTIATYIHPAKPLPDFSLIDNKNKPFTQKTLLGHWTLLFFGYAKCPSICPATLATVTDLFHSIKDIQKDQPHFVFVSLNPQNESPQILDEFLSRFNSNFIGLTGEEVEITKLSKSCSIYSFEEMDAKGQTIIDHSATLLLINPQGQIQALFSPPHKTEELIKDLRILMGYAQSYPQV